MILQQSQSRKHRFSVSFNLDRNQCHEFTIPGDVDKTKLWFTAEEFAQIQAVANRESRVFRQLGFSILLDESYFFSGDQSLDLVQIFLQMNCESLCPRGLERRCSPIHGAERSAYRDQSIRSVLRQQKYLRKKRINFGDIAKELSLTYMRKSDVAGLFARRMARADENVAQDIASGSQRLPAGMVTTCCASSGHTGSRKGSWCEVNCHTTKPDLYSDYPSVAKLYSDCIER
jgi:hypothetical protein